MKCVPVTCGFVSGLRKACGLRVASIKIDPCLNTDAGTTSPLQHGEVFISDDGAEVVPHDTEAIQDGIERVAVNPVDGEEGHADGCVIEFGGTIGDIEPHPVSYRSDNKNFVDERHRHRYELVDDLRIPMNEQDNCSDNRPKKSQITRRTIPSKQEVLLPSKEKKQEVKEDLVKTKKKKRNHKNPPYIYLINTIIPSLVLIFYGKSVSSDMASGISNYSSALPRFDADSCPSFSDGQTNSNPTPLPVSYPLRTAVSPGKVHQVFLNFRGEQLRYNFVSHLRDTLQRHEIKFFIDEYEQRGNDLKQLFVRIKESSIALAIFSTRYSESSWCMDELVKMKELSDQGKLRVIPIFFKVEADDVRKPTVDSEFGRNFLRLAEKSSVHQTKKWKKALQSISDKMGLSFGENSSESDFLYEIVKEIQKVKEAIAIEEKEKPFWWKK